jgi:hypothetical protein
VKTVGIDFASQARETAACVIEWLPRGARVVELTCGVDDAAVLELIARVDKAGIDVPLGWPIAFAEAVATYASGGPWTVTYQHADAAAFRLRRTDIVVRNQVPGIVPMSVAADKIAIPAMRAAALLSQSTPPVARDGSGVVVEVYPAAALTRWGLDCRRYKGSKRIEERRCLVTEFLGRAGQHFQMSEQDRGSCERSDDAFDAVIASFVARASAVGLVESIPLEDHGLARLEGWIAIPLVGSLEALCSLPMEGVPVRLAEVRTSGG